MRVRIQLGLDFWQAQRLIIMPQALKISIPGIVSTFIGLFKDTTLVSIISMFDPVGLIRGRSARIHRMERYLLGTLGLFGLLFFIFCFGMSRYSQCISSASSQTDHRKGGRPCLTKWLIALSTAPKWKSLTKSQSDHQHEQVVRLVPRSA